MNFLKYLEAVSIPIEVANMLLLWIYTMKSFSECLEPRVKGEGDGREREKWDQSHKLNSIWFLFSPKSYSFENIGGKLRIPHKYVLWTFSRKEFYDLLETEGFETPKR